MRVLCCAFTTPGLLYPMVGLALELRRRGHEVAFTTGYAAEPVLGQAGLDRLVGGRRDGTSFQIQRWADPLAAAIDVKHIEYAVRTFQPDVLVANLFVLGACIVRERTDLPLCVMGNVAYLWPRRTPGSPVFPDCEQLARWRYKEMGESLDAARALFGLTTTGTDDDAYPLLGDRLLLRSIPQLEQEPESLPDIVRLVGACEWEPPLDADAAWHELSNGITDHGSVLYVQHGRTFGEPSFWPRLVEALEARPVRVFASTGRMDHATGPVPANFVVRDHMPQSVVLPHADLVVSSGHSSVVLGALTHGLPSVVLPGTGGEMPDNTARLERARCAVRLDPSVSALVLCDAIDTALHDPDLRANARAMRAAFDNVGGFRAAAEALEQLLGLPLAVGERAGKVFA